MADGVLAFPFKLTSDGSAATVMRGSDAETDQAVAVAILTTIGERPMRPTFGVPDPAFAGLHLGDVQVCLNEHGPQDVTIVSIDATPLNNTQSTAEVIWSRGAEGNN